MLKSTTKRKIRALGLFSYLKYRFSAMVNKSYLTIGVFGQGFMFRPLTTDVNVIVDALNKEYSILSKVISCDYGGIIVDAGAHIGTSTISLIKLFPNATIVSIEPDLDNFELLKINTAIYSDKVVLLNAALVPLSMSRSLVKLHDRKTGNWGFSIANEPNNTLLSYNLVNTITLEQIFNSFPGDKIDVIKLDIEGAEKSLFDKDKGAVTRIPVVIAELHDRIVDGCTDSFQRTFSEYSSISAIGHEKLLAVKN